MALKLAVLLSGGGTTLQNIIDHIDRGELDAEVACVVSSRTKAYGLERARNHNIPAIAVNRKDYDDLDQFNCDIWEALREHGSELIVFGGFMSLLDIPDDYVNRIVNVHPALIPAFCGKGMYGHHVYEAVLEYGAKITGVTVHLVDREYDHGPVVMQESVPVLEDDTPDSLADRVMAKEREVYIKALQLFAQGRVKVEGRRVRIS